MTVVDKLETYKRLLAKHSKPGKILDIATGTGDLAIAALKLNPDKITGIDISTGMLKIGNEKIRRPTQIVMAMICTNLFLLLDYREA